MHPCDSPVRRRHCRGKQFRHCKADFTRSADCGFGRGVGRAGLHCFINETADLLATAFDTFIGQFADAGNYTKVLVFVRSELTGRLSPFALLENACSTRCRASRVACLALSQLREVFPLDFS